MQVSSLCGLAGHFRMGGCGAHRAEPLTACGSLVFALQLSQVLLCSALFPLLTQRGAFLDSRKFFG